jgi:hypothetical protein
MELPMENKIKILGISIGVLIILNLLVLDFVWINQQKINSLSSEEVGKESVATPTPISTLPASEITPAEECSEACQGYFDQKINEAISSLPTPASQKTVVPAQSTPSLKVAYITIGGSSSTSSTSWADIPGTDFYFDLSDYPTATGVRWEISLRSYLAGNKVYARLYDVTNKRAVDYSELWSDSGTSELKRSPDLSIWRYNNLYRVQGKSSAGCDAYLDSPRLRILLE